LCGREADADVQALAAGAGAITQFESGAMQERDVLDDRQAQAGAARIGFQHTGGIALQAPVQVREAGQWAIGTALGLYSTPAVLHVLSSYVGTIALGVVFAMLLGIGAGWLLHRLKLIKIRSMR